jgi:hypothetical protein
MAQQQYQAAISNCALMNKSLVTKAACRGHEGMVCTVNDQATAHCLIATPSSR